MWLAGRRFSWNRRKRRLRASRASFQALLTPGATKAMHAAIARVPWHRDNWNGRGRALLLRCGSRGGGAPLSSSASHEAVPHAGHVIREPRVKSPTSDGAVVQTPPMRCKTQCKESLGKPWRYSNKVYDTGSAAAAPSEGDIIMCTAADFTKSVDMLAPQGGLSEVTG
eukprot:s1711_g4.t1